MAGIETTVGAEELGEEFRATLKHGLVPYVRSSPGVGKSDISKGFAARYNLKVIDIRLSQCTPEDLQGFPMRVGNKATFVPFDLFPLQGEPLPEMYEEDGVTHQLNADGSIKKYNGWLLLMDELSSANKQTQAAAYKLILDRQVGSFKLHDACMPVACGNNEADKAVVTKMSTALQSRLIHYKLEIGVKEWVKWGNANGIDFRILAYVQFNPAMLNNFQPDHKDLTYACQRTWTFLSKLIKDETRDPQDMMARICGTVGQAAGIEFISFCKVMKSIPDWNDLLDPKINTKIATPAEASAKFATICWMAAKAQHHEVKLLLPYVKRFGGDFQVIFCRGIFARFENIDQQVKEVGDFASSIATQI